MSNVTSSLTIKLNDDLSGPAGKAAAALTRLGASGSDLKKLAAASPETARLVRELERLKALAGKVDTFKVASRGLDDMGLNLKKARNDIAQAEKLVVRKQKTLDHFNRIKVEQPERYARWKQDGLTDRVVDNLDKAKRAKAKADKALPGAEAEFREQGRAVLALRKELVAAGVPIKGMREAETSLKSSIDATNASIAKQPALIAAAEAKAAEAARAASARMRDAVAAGRAAKVEREVATARVGRVEKHRAEVRAARPGMVTEEGERIGRGKSDRAKVRAAGDPLEPAGRGEADLRKVPELAKPVADLSSLRAKAGAIEEFKVDSRGLKEASLAHRKAQQDLRALKAEMASAPSDAVAARLMAAQAAATRASAAFHAQGAAVRASRSALSEVGVSVDRLRSSEVALASGIAQATAALQKQTSALASNAAAQAKASAVAKERAAARKDAAGVIAGGAAIKASTLGRKIAADAITSVADFDIATRKQKVFADLEDADQAPLQAQAKKIGQETQFSNIDVVKAQTASMQGLPSGFASRLKSEVAAGIVENVRDYSTLMETDLKEGSETIRAYLQQTGKDISTKEKALAEAQKATNQLVKMAKIGGMDGDDVKLFLKFAASPGTAAQVSTDTMLTLGALARQGGLRGDEAGVFMRSTASKLVSPTTKGIAALNAAGINHSDYVKMPETLSTAALENQFRNSSGKSFTPEVRKKVDAVNTNKDLIADRAKYTAAITAAVGDILGKKKDGTVRASDSKVAAKAAGEFHKLSAKSFDTEGLLDRVFSSNMTLPQLNAFLTDKHGGKGAITARQWEEFKSARAKVKAAGDDPNMARDKAKEVMSGVGGSWENMKGSLENFTLQVGTANSGLIRLTADGIGNAVDSFSKLSTTTQQVLSLMGGGAALAGGAWGAYKLAGAVLGKGAGAAALVGSAVALDASAAALTAAAGRLALSGGLPGGLPGGVPGSSVPAAAPVVATASLLGPALVVASVAAGGAAASVIATEAVKNRDFADPYLEGGILGADPAGYGLGAGIIHAPDLELSKALRAQETQRDRAAQADREIARKAREQSGVRGSSLPTDVGSGLLGFGLEGERPANAAMPSRPPVQATATRINPAADLTMPEFGRSPFDPAPIAAATAALSAYRAELAVIKADMAAIEAGGDMDLIPALGSLGARKAAVEERLSAMKARLKAMAPASDPVAASPLPGAAPVDLAPSEPAVAARREAPAPPPVSSLPPRASVPEPAVADPRAASQPVALSPPVPIAVTPRAAAPVVAAGRAADDPRTLAVPPAPDAGKIAEATAQLASYRQELAGIKADLATGLDMPGLGSGMEARKAELQAMIEGIEGRLKALGATTIAPQVDGSAVEGLGTSAATAGEKLSALGATTVAPQVDRSSVDSLSAALDAALAKLARLGSGIAAARSQASAIAVPSAPRASAGPVAAAGGEGLSTGRLRHALQGSFSNGNG